MHKGTPSIYALCHKAQWFGSKGFNFANPEDIVLQESRKQIRPLIWLYIRFSGNPWRTFFILGMMRIWEFEESKDRVIPSDLVREQDFILRIRRLNRLATPHLVMNLAMANVIEHIQKPTQLHAIQKQLQDFASVTSGTYCEMSNGDVFIIWEETGDAQLLSSRILSLLMPEETADTDGSGFLKSYHLPQDYSTLRERANHYIEVVREANAAASETPLQQALQSDAARGPLTAWSVDQIVKLLKDIDLSQYVRKQTVCQYQASGMWLPVAEEYFIGFHDLRRERFPKLELMTPEHLFLVLCETLDQLLLAQLTNDKTLITGKAQYFNLAITSTLSAGFAAFARSLTAEQRSHITFELHRGDLLQDFARTLNVIQLIKYEGFCVALDSITPDMVNYLDLAAFQTDIIKIKASKEYLGDLQNPKVRAGLSKLPSDRLIFSHCDSEKTLAVGLDLGVSRFQGWLIDLALSKQT